MKNPRVNKRQLELDRKARAERKRQRRQDRSSAAPVEQHSAADQQATLQALADLHRKYEDGEISFDDFEAAKNELTSRLDVI